MPHSSADMVYGVSNSFRRGLPRTYSRRTRPLGEEGHPRKLIRMDDAGFVKIETSSGRPGAGTGKSTASQDVPDVAQDCEASSLAPSTPVREAIFSDPSLIASSPLSSPADSPPVTKTHKPAFSLLKRKRSDSGVDSRDVIEASRPSTPLTEITGNDRYSSQGSGGRLPAAKKPRLTQMTLDLGQDARRTCKGCGMSYISSSAEDTTIHKAFHSTNISGVDVGKGFSKEARNIGTGSGEAETVVMVDRKSAPALRRRVEKVLEVVRQDLGAVEIEPDKLWDSMPCPVSGRKFGKALARAKEKGEEEEPREDCFKAFLFLDRDKCVGFCLAERVSKAMKVAESESSASQNDSAVNKHAGGIKSSSVTAERTTNSVLLGISRIWTSRSHRRKGVATALLDCARLNYFYGIEVPKEMVAFSQPTESGGQLAQRWYEQRAGWHVYES